MFLHDESGNELYVPILHQHVGLDVDPDLTSDARGQKDPRGYDDIHDGDSILLMGACIESD